LIVAYIIYKEEKWKKEMINIRNDMIKKEIDIY